MDEAFKIAERVSFITPARFLFNAGKTPKAWNQKMLEDEHLKVVYYEKDAGRVFTNNIFEGGVAITYRDANIVYGAIGQYTNYSELNSIIQKIALKKEASITTVIYLQCKFDLAELYKIHPEYSNVIGSEGKERRLTTSIFESLGDLFTDVKQAEDDLMILGLSNSKRISLYIPRIFIEPTVNLDKYKVLVSKSNGASGTLGDEPARIISTPEIGVPAQGFTQSFLSIGTFDSYSSAEAAFKYIKTKFARAMLGVLKVTQDNPPEKWRYVPLQDFTTTSDIKWSKSISEIDQQLFKKYGLDANEIDFIESHIKEME